MVFDRTTQVLSHHSTHHTLFCAAARTYNIPSGQPLEKTPGYSMLLPMQQVTSITITQAPVTWKVSALHSRTLWDVLAVACAEHHVAQTDI
jgi:hypothetical protein